MQITIANTLDKRIKREMEKVMEQRNISYGILISLIYLCCKDNIDEIREEYPSPYPFKKRNRIAFSTRIEKSIHEGLKELAIKHKTTMSFLIELMFVVCKDMIPILQSNFAEELVMIKRKAS